MAFKQFDRVIATKTFSYVRGKTGGTEFKKGELDNYQVIKNDLGTVSEAPKDTKQVKVTWDKDVRRIDAPIPIANVTVVEY